MDQEEVLLTVSSSTPILLPVRISLFDVSLERNWTPKEVEGPAGEGFNNPREFIEMLQKYPGKYNAKKVFGG